jgi:hypothetical protein
MNAEEYKKEANHRFRNMVGFIPGARCYGFRQLPANGLTARGALQK